MTTASLISNPLTQLWREARAWLAEMLADFISPAQVARAVARQARAAFAKRLRMLQCFVMKLLLIEATRQSSPARGGGRERPQERAEREGCVRTHPSASRCALDSSPQRGEHVQYAEHPDHPITWRVRFHLRIPRQRRRAAATPAPRIPQAPACPQTLALRLARRFEALRRVIADPRRAIAALARKLAALAGAARAVAHRIALASPRQGGGPIFADATVQACDASFDLPDDTS
jgi:hypothetical protein